MTKRPRTLTAAFVRTVGRPGVYGDGRGGRGLSLRVHRTASGRITKTWRQLSTMFLQRHNSMTYSKL